MMNSSEDQILTKISTSGGGLNCFIHSACGKFDGSEFYAANAEKIRKDMIAAMPQYLKNIATKYREAKRTHNGSEMVYYRKILLIANGITKENDPNGTMETWFNKIESGSDRNIRDVVNQVDREYRNGYLEAMFADILAQIIKKNIIVYQDATKNEFLQEEIKSTLYRLVELHNQGFFDIGESDDPTIIQIDNIIKELTNNALNLAQYLKSDILRTEFNNIVDEKKDQLERVIACEPILKKYRGYKAVRDTDYSIDTQDTVHVHHTDGHFSRLVTKQEINKNPALKAYLGGKKGNKKPEEIKIPIEPKKPKPGKKLPINPAITEEPKGIIDRILTHQNNIPNKPQIKTNKISTIKQEQIDQTDQSQIKANKTPIYKPKPANTANNPQQTTTVTTQQQTEENDDQYFKQIKAELDDFVSKYKKYTADEISFDDLPLSEDKIKHMVNELYKNNKISEEEGRKLIKLAEIAYGIKKDYPEYKKFPLSVQILYPEIAKNVDMKKLLQDRDKMPTDSHFDILIIQAFQAKADLEKIAKAKKQATNNSITYLLLSLILPILVIVAAYYAFKGYQLGKAETKLSLESNELTRKAQNYATNKLKSSKSTTHSL